MSRSILSDATLRFDLALGVRRRHAPKSCQKWPPAVLIAIFVDHTTNSEPLDFCYVGFGPGAVTFSSLMQYGVIIQFCVLPMYKVASRLYIGIADGGAPFPMLPSDSI